MGSSLIFLAPMSKTFLRFTPRSPKLGPEAERRAEKKRAAAAHAKAKAAAKSEKTKHPLYQSKYVAKMKFRNSLPDVPVDSRFLAYPFPTSRFAKYVPTTLERDAKRLYTLKEAGLGLGVSLVQPMRYSHGDDNVSYVANPHPDDIRRLLSVTRESALSQALHPDDEVLIELGESSLVEKNTVTIDDAPFLRKGQYLGNEYHNVNVGSRENNDIERLHGRSMAGKEVKILSLTEQKDIIDASFASAAKAPKHPRKVGMKAKRVFSLLPDANIRPENVSIVSFAQKPTEDSTQGAIIKGIENAPGGDDRAPVMYLLPKKSARKRQKRLRDKDVTSSPQDNDNDNDDKEGDGNPQSTYTWVREYQSNVRQRGDRLYLWSLQEDTDSVSFVPIKITVSLTKRKPIGSIENPFSRPSAITSSRYPPPPVPMSTTSSTIQPEGDSDAE